MSTYRVRPVPIIHEGGLHTFPEPWGLFLANELVQTFPTRAEANDVRRLLKNARP